MIYYFVSERSQIYMLLACAKNEQPDLTSAQLKSLRELVKQELDDGR